MTLQLSSPFLRLVTLPPPLGLQSPHPLDLPKPQLTSDLPEEPGPTAPPYNLQHSPLCSLCDS